MLDDHCPVTNGAAADQMADPGLHYVAATQVAVDGNVEQRPVAPSFVFIEVETDRPDVTTLQGAMATSLSCLLTNHHSHPSYVLQQCCAVDRVESVALAFDAECDRIFTRRIEADRALYN